MMGSESVVKCFTQGCAKPVTNRHREAFFASDTYSLGHSAKKGLTENKLARAFMIKQRVRKSIGDFNDGMIKEGRAEPPMLPPLMQSLLSTVIRPEDIPADLASCRNGTMILPNRP